MSKSMLGKKIKAAILVEQRKPLVVSEIELPKTLDYGQVLVKIYYTGICGSQLNEIDGTKGPDKFLPHLLGHEGSGVVEEVGSGVKSVKPGDHVVLHWRKGEGIHSATSKYKWGDKSVNAGWVTTFSEYSVVSENRVTMIPKNFDMKTAPLYGCAITTAYGVIHNDSNMKMGDSIAVFGAGGVGVALVLMASLISAYPIIAIDINDYKLKKAKEFGATHIINSSKEDVKKKILEIVPGGVDVGVDTTGISSVREMCYELTSKEGITVGVGVPKAGTKICIDSFPLHFTKKITGSHGGDADPSYIIPRLARLQQSGRFDLENMITHTFSLDEINKAIEMVRTGDTVRCIVDMSK
ncbi:MAG: zinc-binding dehydrogenase [Nanoarchaeota archaeon]|nr:zinc-binding dehydrogenase [Nanoarchaeota archaeon]MBU1320874.1 zinc-binding dehydrogenase [Nanoarchaeota archaeon]MBU1597780.1 zinc-binding dehydrogenase [Nanoarchaeota archaeon]MBU2441231.1 zinc-binding dehydrogenase [Nanoarchaeota archaeon]